MDRVCSCTHQPPCVDRTDMEERHGTPAAFRRAALSCSAVSTGEALAAADRYSREWSAAPHRTSEQEAAAALAATILRHCPHRAHEDLEAVARGVLHNYASWRDRLRRADGPDDPVSEPYLPDDSFVEEDYKSVLAELGARRFHLVRDVDRTGVSGTGRVAVGVVFAHGFLAGRAALHWLTERRSTAHYGSAEDLEAIHGHGGATRLVYADEPQSTAAAGVTILRLAPSGGAVELLEEVLADARRGHIRSVAFATVSSKRHVGTGFHLEESAGLEPHALVGALERLKARLLIEPTGL